MGLDNGIILKVNPDILITNKLVQLDKTWSDNPKTEVCYWRKCWGIRNAIVDKFHFDIDGVNHKLDAEDIPVIIKILFSFYGKEEWEENADSIWEWEEFKDTLRQQIINLTWLYDYMLANPEVEVIFYNSY